jgi:hypothetical protein
MKATGQQPIEAVSDPRKDEYSQGQQKLLIKKQGDKYWNQRHPDDG